MSTTAKYHIESAFPVLLARAADEQCVIRDVQKVEDYTVYTWSMSGKLKNLKTQEIVEKTYLEAFELVAKKKRSILVVHDMRNAIEMPDVYRHLIELSPVLKKAPSTIVLSSPDWTNCPPELLHNAPILEYGLPSREELGEVLDRMHKDYGAKLKMQNKDQFQEVRNELINASTGFTLEEADSAFALSLSEVGYFCPLLVAREKMRMVRSTGYMEVCQPVDPKSIGGLTKLKEYLYQMSPWKDDPQLSLRGLVISGPPGVGKSLSAKCVGSIFGYPVISASLARCKGSLVGQSEARLRAMLDMAEAVSPCVLWIDECDKALAGAASSAETDGGTTMSMLGVLLTWLQEHQKSIITVCTARFYNLLPDEFTRAGRFDERFFVDLPGEEGRLAIAEIHANRLECELKGKKLLNKVAEMTEGWTGSEIEELIKSSARRGNRELSESIIKECKKEIIPISESQKETIAEQRTELAGILRPAC